MSVIQIVSQDVVIERNIDKVFDFLSDLTNYRELMPDTISDFEAQPDLAKMSMNGLGTFNIKVSESVASEKITLTPSGKLPFDFNIQWLLKEQDGKTVVSGVVNATLNVFMKMMAESRLRDFVTTQASKMKIHIESHIVDQA